MNKANGTAKTAVRKAFAVLRKEANLFCTMRGSCCMGCSCVELEPKAKEKNKQGVVYFHRQDGGNYRSTGQLNVRYFPVAKSGLSPKMLGELVMVALSGVGHPRINIEWDGSPERTINVLDL